jgi:hypothetical protein
MTLLTIAELMAGELLVSPGGVVDGVTATGDEVVMWQHVALPPADDAVEELRELVLAGV